MTRVLLVRLSAMGDVVQSLGAAAALHAARPDLELWFVTQREHAPLLQGLPALHGVVEHDRRGGLSALLRTRRALRARAFDVALDLQGNGKSALLARLSGARLRIGAAGRWRQEPWSAWLLTRLVPVPGPRHPALVAHAVVQALAPGAAFAAPRLSATAAEIDAAARQVRQLGIEPLRPFRVLVGGRDGDIRSQDRAAFAREIATSPWPVLVVLGPQESACEIAGAAVLHQQRGQLRQLVALGALCAAAGGDAVGPDQGPVHVLAATGARTVLLAGPQDPECTQPPAAVAMRHRTPPPCAPCRRRDCRHPDGPVCMGFTTAEAEVVGEPSWLRGGAP